MCYGMRYYVPRANHTQLRACKSGESLRVARRLRENYFMLGMSSPPENKNDSIGEDLRCARVYIIGNIIALQL